MADRDKRRDLRSWRGKRTHEKNKAKRNADRGIPTLCWFCKNPIDLDLHPSAREAWTLHHLDPLNTGGHILGETVPAHRCCNSSYGDGSKVDPLLGRTRAW